jgi:hypothetical protein
LIRDPERRIQLAKNGFEFVRQLTWERASDSLEAALYIQAQTSPGAFPSWEPKKSQEIPNPVTW